MDYASEYGVCNLIRIALQLSKKATAARFHDTFQEWANSWLFTSQQAWGFRLSCPLATPSHKHLHDEHIH
eukprot:4075665-Amphidinium_carterae.1